MRRSVKIWRLDEREWTSKNWINYRGNEELEKWIVVWTSERREKVSKEVSKEILEKIMRDKKMIKGERGKDRIPT